MDIRIAQRKKVKIRLGLQGPSGSGKTYSSLLMARGLVNDWSQIAVIDTEQSADLYAHLGNYRVLNLGKPYSPESYIKAISACENNPEIEVIIIDSISQEWTGEGGVIEMHGNLTGNSFTNWNYLTRRHNNFVEKMLQSRCHVIATIRSKQGYLLTDKKGKMVPVKIGLKGIQRDNLNYELTVLLEIDQEHRAIATKDRTGLFVDKPSFVISESTGELILEWCNLGAKAGIKSLDSIKSEISAAKDMQTLVDIYNRYPEFQDQIKPLCVAAKQALTLPDVIHSGNDPG